jgi:hypothetical protein
MLTTEQIHDLAEKHQLRVVCHWESSTHGRALPQLRSLSVYIPPDHVEAWVAIMSDTTAVPVTVTGTRQVTGSGATDDTLFPCYAAELKRVNASRATVGLEPIRN